MLKASTKRMIGAARANKKAMGYGNPKRTKLAKWMNGMRNRNPKK